MPNADVAAGSTQQEPHCFATDNARRAVVRRGSTINAGQPTPAQSQTVCARSDGGWRLPDLCRDPVTRAATLADAFRRSASRADLSLTFGDATTRRVRTSFW